MSILRRPNLSAEVVSQRVMPASPARVRLNKIPTELSTKPTWMRYSTRMTETKPYANRRSALVENRMGMSRLCILKV